MLFWVILKSNSRSRSLSITALSVTSMVSHVAVVSRGVKTNCICEKVCMPESPVMVWSILLWSKSSLRLKRKLRNNTFGRMGILLPCQA